MHFFTLCAFMRFYFYGFGKTVTPPQDASLLSDRDICCSPPDRGANTAGGVRNRVQWTRRAFSHAHSGWGGTDPACAFIPCFLAV